ncbi:Protein of unknown function [Haloechinothrix alba]|uniref:DUF3017 domain-containing protein n=1 Tax=Haloechinothrix alba TaxID=664784 RepID=A0A238VW33_9PSEU|nr:DUF3017 domain-containing protein [Haloechinothrix alba]SNR37699.1 Protein of unknown function [Haloechinothrix alba]
MVSRLARWRQPVVAHLPFGVVLVMVAAAMVRIAQYHWREGAALIALSLLAAALMRAVLSTERAGLLVIRGRAVDVAYYSAFGLMIMAVALTITGGPFH